MVLLVVSSGVVHVRCHGLPGNDHDPLGIRNTTPSNQLGVDTPVGRHVPCSAILSPSPSTRSPSRFRELALAPLRRPIPRTTEMSS